MEDRQPPTKPHGNIIREGYPEPRNDAGGGGAGDGCLRGAVGGLTGGGSHARAGAGCDGEGEHTRRVCRCACALERAGLFRSAAKSTREISIKP